MPNPHLQKRPRCASSHTPAGTARLDSKIHSNQYIIIPSHPLQRQKSGLSHGQWLGSRCSTRGKWPRSMTSPRLSVSSASMSAHPLARRVAVRLRRRSPTSFALRRIPRSGSRFFRRESSAPSCRGTNPTASRWPVSAPSRPRGPLRAAAPSLRDLPSGLRPAAHDWSEQELALGITEP